MPRSRTTYEWVIEMLDADGVDIIDVDHADTYAEALRRSGGEARIGLVRDVGNDSDGLIDRCWAYVVDGALPLHFENEQGDEIALTTPLRFRKEVA